MRKKYRLTGKLFEKLIDIERKYPFREDKIISWMNNACNCPCGIDGLTDCLTDDPNLEDEFTIYKAIKCNSCYRSRQYLKLMRFIRQYFSENSRKIFYIFLIEELKKILEENGHEVLRCEKCKRFFISLNENEITCNTCSMIEKLRFFI